MNRLSDVFEEPYLLSKLLSVKDKRTGLKVSLAPPPVLPSGEVDLCFPPRFGEHNQDIYGSLGYDVELLVKNDII